jgi:hypothetical protein
MNPPSERRLPLLPLTKADAGASPGVAGCLKYLIAHSPDVLAIIKVEGAV